MLKWWAFAHHLMTNMLQNSDDGEKTSIAKYLIYKTLNNDVKRLVATDEEEIEASKMSHVHHFIQTLPDGYNMI